MEKEGSSHHAAIESKEFEKNDQESESGPEKMQGIFLEVSRGHNGHNAKTPFFLKACDQAAPTDRGAGGKGFPGDMAFCSFAYHRTQILRDCFDCHFDGPVDTDADKRFKLNL